jgi:putative DNA methylase
MATNKNKSELQAEQVAALVGAGKAVTLESVDFSDPNRPKTCLEVDFPILPVNRVASIEGASSKPIYQMSKWWARRRSSVFRSMLIAAATKAPDDENLAAKTVWDAYYANHQKRGSFKGLKVAEIFMGGGTTVVEADRLGMQTVGNDLNPVAWFVVKNEIAKVDLAELNNLLRAVETEVGPQIAAHQAVSCPRGHNGVWTDLRSGRKMGADFDGLTLTAQDRRHFSYAGPEVIYTFWVKHGPCSAQGCGHRTPLLSSPVVSMKTISVKVWEDFKCSCGQVFDVEQGEARMAPSAPLVISPSERKYSAMGPKGTFTCPACGEMHSDYKAKVDGNSVALGKGTSKKVSLTLLVNPQWMNGAQSGNGAGSFGGSVNDDAASTARWFAERSKNLSYVEVRGELPEVVEVPGLGLTLETARSNIPLKAKFACQEATCGRVQAIVESMADFGTTAPIAPYAQQCYCPHCDAEGQLYGGRFFQEPNVNAINASLCEWESRKNGDLKGLWPESEIPFGHMTHQRQPLPQHGYFKWIDMFNPRQLLVHTQLLRSILNVGEFSWGVRESVLGAFQQYLRNQNMFCFWNPQGDKLEPHFSNNNYHPKTTVIENCVFPSIGRGNWASCVEGVVEGLEWANDPWEIVANSEIGSRDLTLAKELSGKGEKVRTNDPLTRSASVMCGSSTDIPSVATESHDLVITDPPFGGLLHYSELADFFYVWMRLALKDKYPEIFSGAYTPKTLEAVSNKARHPDDPDAFYERLLTACWAEAHRILKPGGLLAFTFHHSEDEPWVSVLKSLFDAGFYLEATYPIRSDETKGEGEFGSKTIEYDIIHVCRKRVDDPTPISWAKLRRKIVDDVRDLKGLLEQHQASGLPRADLEVIRRGKALEYYSRHYGHVYVERGREFTLLEALAGIHQLLDDERDESGVAPPVLAEVHTRQFLRIFDKAVAVDRNDMVKYLRGTGTAPSLFEAYGWCSEEKKVYHLCDPLEFAKGWRGKHRKGMSRDLDQTLFLIGACFLNSGMRVDETLNNPNFDPHPAVSDLLDWMLNRGGSKEIQSAAKVAKQLYAKWLSENKTRAEAVMKQFDIFEEQPA